MNLNATLGNYFLDALHENINHTGHLLRSDVVGGCKHAVVPKRAIQVGSPKHPHNHQILVEASRFDERAKALASEIECRARRNVEFDTPESTSTADVVYVWCGDGARAQ